MKNSLVANESKLIILDRDGVINYDSDDYIKSPEEWMPISGSLEAISRLNKARYKVAIATNQSGIARGYYNIDVLEGMHVKMRALLAKLGGTIDYIAYCPHGPRDDCFCRKPKPGMLLEISKAFSIEPKNAVFIGDSVTDTEAAKAANMKFVLVKTGKGERSLISERSKKNELGFPYPVFDSLLDYVENLLGVNQ